MSQDMDGFERVDEREFTEQEKTEKTDKFPCPGCGANMKFNPDTQTLTCEYCSRSIEIASEDTEIEEHDFLRPTIALMGIGGRKPGLSNVKDAERKQCSMFTVSRRPVRSAVLPMWLK